MKHDESSNYIQDIGLSELDELNRLLAKTLEDFKRGCEKVFSIFQECSWQSILSGLKKEILSERPDQEIEKHISQLEKRLEITRYLAEEAEKFLINSGLAVRAIEEGNDLVNIVEEEDPIVLIEGLKAQGLEKRRIARDIHDGPAQDIAGMLIRLGLAKQAEEIGQIKAEIESIEDLGKKCLLELRHIIFDLKPPFLEPGPFSASISNYFAEYQSTYRFRVNYLSSGDLDEIDYSLRTVLFRLIQEAVNNSRKHSGVNQALVKIANKERLITIIIEDNGKGFDPTKAIKGAYGISGMEERVKAIEGEMQILSSPEAGTRINIKAPLERKERSHGKDQGINC